MKTRIIVETCRATGLYRYRNAIERFLGRWAAAVGLAAVAATSIAADTVEITEAWVRATGPAQPVAGAYMTLRSTVPLELVAIKTPVAKHGEVHEMKHEGGVMKMRAVPALALRPGIPTVLGPGGLHLMLFGLKHPLEAGQTVALTLEFRRADGKVLTRRVDVPVKAAAEADDHAGHAR